MLDVGLYSRQTLLIFRNKRDIIQLKNESTEDMSVMEGKRIYDIKFAAHTPQNRQIALIVNLESIRLSSVRNTIAQG